MVHYRPARNLPLPGTWDQPEEERMREEGIRIGLPVPGNPKLLPEQGKHAEKAFFLTERTCMLSSGGEAISVAYQQWRQWNIGLPALEALPSEPVLSLSACTAAQILPPGITNINQGTFVQAPQKPF